MLDSRRCARIGTADPHARSGAVSRKKMLILLRRIFAIILIPVFLMLFLLTLLIWQILATIGDPEAIKEELVKADIYNFIYDDVMEPLLIDALEEVVADPGKLLNDDLIELEIRPETDSPEIVGLLRYFLPPDELQARVEHVIDEFVPYITGDTDEFQIQLRLGERVRAWPELVASRLDALDAGDRLSSAVLGPILESSLDALQAEGLDVAITPQRAREIAQSVVPGDWIETQFVNATRDVSGWLTRTEDHFQVTVQFADRIPRATQALKDVLDEANAEQFLFQSLIEPELNKALGSFTALSHGILISDEEIAAAIEEVAPVPWIREQRNGIIDSLSGYMSGETDQLALSIDLSGRGETAAAVLIDLAERKLRELVDGTPDCRTITEGLRAAQDVQRGRFPSCKPAEINSDTILSVLSGPFKTEIERLIVTQIPDSFTFTENDLAALIGESSVQSIDNVRKFVADGFTYTDTELRVDIAKRNSDFTLDDLDVVRDLLDDNHTFTETDFTDSFLRNRPDLLDDFDNVRDQVGRGRSLWFLVFFVPGLVLLIIAFLGGRNWNSRLKWAMFPVFVSGLLIWIATSPVYDAYAQDEIDMQIIRITGEIEREEARVVVAEALDRGVDVLTRWKSEFGSRAGYFAIASGIVLAGSIGVSIFGTGNLRRPRRPSGGGGGPAPSDPGADAAYEASREKA